MLITALWVLDKQWKWYHSEKRKRYFTHRPIIDRNDPSRIFASDVPPWIPPFMIGTAVAQTALIGSFPYIGMVKAAGYADDYVWKRTAPQHAIKAFEFGPGIRGFRPVGWSQSRRAGARLAAAKLASRFIPYVGWGLAAYDVYSVGKYAYRKFR